MSVGGGRPAEVDFVHVVEKTSNYVVLRGKTSTEGEEVTWIRLGNSSYYTEENFKLIVDPLHK